MVGALYKLQLQRLVLAMALADSQIQLPADWDYAVHISSGTGVSPVQLKPSILMRFAVETRPARRRSHYRLAGRLCERHNPDFHQLTVDFDFVHFMHNDAMAVFQRQ